MLEKHDARRNRNGRAGSAPAAPFTAHTPSRRGNKPSADVGAKAASTAGRGLKLRRYFTDGREASALEVDGSERGLGDYAVPRYLLIWGAPAVTGQGQLLDDLP